MGFLIFFIGVLSMVGNPETDTARMTEPVPEESPEEGIGLGVEETVSLGEDDAEDPTAGLVAEPQNPTGKFTTATEVRPILNATRANWVAVREYDGQDLVYFTHLWAWRCGLLQMRYSVNGGPLQPGPLPLCHENEAQPNAIKSEDGLPYVGFPLGSVTQVDVTIIYDDLETDHITVDRQGVLIP